MNLYRYVQNNPVNKMDPSGLEHWYERYAEGEDVWPTATHPVDPHEPFSLPSLFEPYGWQVESPAYRAELKFRSTLNNEGWYWDAGAREGVLLRLLAAVPEIGVNFSYVYEEAHVRTVINVLTFSTVHTNEPASRLADLHEYRSRVGLANLPLDDKVYREDIVELLKKNGEVEFSSWDRMMMDAGLGDQILGAVVLVSVVVRQGGIPGGRKASSTGVRRSAKTQASSDSGRAGPPAESGVPGNSPRAVGPPAPASRAARLGQEAEAAPTGEATAGPRPASSVDTRQAGRTMAEGVAPNTPKGTWVKESTAGWSDRAKAYQQQITGRPAGEAFEVNGRRFDGPDPSGCGLLDAKGPGYARGVKNGRFQEWYKGADGLLKEASGQVVAANGAKITWHVAEADAATAIRNLLKDNGISGIDVVHTPPIAP